MSFYESVSPSFCIRKLIGDNVYSNKLQMLTLIAIIIINAQTVMTWTENTQNTFKNHQSTGRMLQSNSLNCSEPISVSSNAIILGNCQNQLYLIQLEMGTPPQPLNYIIDTTSNYLWVSTIITNESGFNFSHSTTSQLTGTIVQIQVNNNIIQMPNGQQFYGQSGIDIVAINDSSISVVPQIYFVNSVISEQPNIVSGVVGLSHSEKHKNIFDLAWKNGEIQSSTFIIDLNIAPTQSYFYYNHLPQEIVRNSIEIETNSHQDFTLEIIGFWAGETQYTHAVPDLAVLDSGAGYFYLSQKLFNAVTGRFFNTCISTGNGVICECSDVVNWPTFRFMFAGAQTYIEPSHYMVQLQNGCTYGFGISPTSGQSAIYLGTSFFYGYNITFNKQQNKVGLQGNLTKVQLINFPYFQIPQYILLCAAIGLAVFAGYLIWFLRMIKHQKITRLSEITLTDRFIYD